MTIDLIHSRILFVLDKEISGYNPPAEIDLALDMASMWLFNERLPYYAVNQKAQDDLAPFKKLHLFTNGTTAAGVITLPTVDYLHFNGAWYTGFDNDLGKNVHNEIEILNDDEIGERLRSELIPVTVTKPIGQWIGKGKIQLHPKSPSVGEAWYLKRPAIPVFAYTQVGRTVTYNGPGSTQLEWDDGCMNKIMIKALSLLGVNLSEDRLIQYSQIKDAEPV